ncbi:TIGR00341 family protein [Oscillatoria sp. CS-180]|uniref:TIGR00341 family protein n=1 Tax=Oscillatoria sp. CS-180 TaxID=3021720 RepID=UPI00232B220A|nr:TIGR00341 family protein [Oscillatoria sp. CS-180]MDB9525129.1 TIGR00341 family protein [Oscillatoria sp. CS-180]
MLVLKEWIQAFRKKYLTEGRRVSPQALKHMSESLFDEARPGNSFKVLTLGACVIATFGLLANSTAVIIGAMLIAPLMLPIRGLSFGILEADRDLIRTSIRAICIGTALAIAVSMLLGMMVNLSNYGSEVWGRTRPTLLDLGIAITAGALAGFAKIETKLSSSLAGTAIAVALMPPLCVVGLWLAKFEFQTALGAMLLYITNLLGITLACMVAFLWAGYSPLDRARRPLSLTLALTAVLLVPLGFTSYKLIRQDRLESNLRRALLDRTITFQRLRLVAMETDWFLDPPAVNLTVYATAPVTPVQVDLLEKFVADEMGRPFRLVFEVSRLEEVTSTPVSSMDEGSSIESPNRWEEN